MFEYFCSEMNAAPIKLTDYFVTENKARKLQIKNYNIDEPTAKSIALIIPFILDIEELELSNN